MNISVKGEYALQAIFDLASQHSVEPVKIAEIAQRQKIPPKFLELTGRTQAGRVRRVAPRRKGGYLLARAADSLTVGEVLRFIEGAQSSKGRPRQKAGTPFTNMWQQVDRDVAAGGSRRVQGDR